MSSAATFPSRYLNLAAARAQYGDRVDRLGPYLLQSDPLADNVVADLRPLGREAHVMLDRAARMTTEEIAGDRSLPQSLRALLLTMHEVPFWVDWKLLNQGGRLLFRTGIISGIVLGARSIVLGYASAGNKPLVLAGGLLERASRRLSETARYVHAVCMQQGLRAGAEGFVATVHVRMMHAYVRHMALSQATWRSEDYGTPINQHDMLATTLLFSWVLIEGLRNLGVRVGDEEAEAFIHLWRYAGYLMGVRPELLPANMREASALAGLIAATQGSPDDDARRLVRALITSGERDARSQAERVQARRAVHLLQGAATLLHGREMARDLGFEGSPLERAARPLVLFVSAAEALRERSSVLADFQLAQGTAYWDRVRDTGFTLYGDAFQLPEVS
jgi:hypothetical protein